jgi:two-component system cell cycle sensor histidine kinase PleC
MMKKVKLNNNLKITNDEEMLRQIEITHENGASSLIDERPLSNGGFITMIFDISEKVKAQNELKKVQYRQRQMAKEIEREKIKAEAASRSKTSFLAHLSHDVRTPLNHIIGFSDLISHQTFGPIGDDRYLKYINDIKSSGEKLLESFSEILELAQLEGGDLILKLEDIELEKTLQATINRFKDSAKRAGIKLELNVPQDMIFHTDKLCVERMLNNIIENSIRFTPKGGAIKISSWLADDGVVFEISDTGIGISAERLLDLDQPFVLGDAAFTREGGVGLGIAISRAIAQLNGGQLAIDSTPALGTTVVISLPTDLSEKSALSNVA